MCPDVHNSKHALCPSYVSTTATPVSGHMWVQDEVVIDMPVGRRNVVVVAGRSLD